MLDVQRQHHAEGRAALEAELQQLRNEMANLEEEYDYYREEVDSQVQACRKVVKRILARHNLHFTQSSGIHVTPQSPVEQTAVCGGKRKSTTLEESSTSIKLHKKILI
jgi:cell shape-determining protein MreC